MIEETLSRLQLNELYTLVKLDYCQIGDKDDMVEWFGNGEGGNYCFSLFWNKEASTAKWNKVREKFIASMKL